MDSEATLSAEEILSDEEIERRADSFNLDSDDWSSYVHHWKGYRDGLLASRDAVASLTARAVRAEADAKRLDWVLDNCYVEIARRDGDRLLNDRADVDAQMAIDAARAALATPRPATP